MSSEPRDAFALRFTGSIANIPGSVSKGVNMRQPLVAGNWKMNGSQASIASLLAGIKDGVGPLSAISVAVCPPFPYIPMCCEALAGTPVAVGAQNVCAEPMGAFTGEVAASMLADLGCTYVIIGHSERRQLFGETDAAVAQKFALAQSVGLVPIVCVGETLTERETGRTTEVVARQVDAILNHLGVAAFRNSVIAYEPVWAIGTGITATPSQAQEIHAFIRDRIAAADPAVAAELRILYGGSMKPSNAAELMAEADIDGGLIGGASLVAADFLAICEAANASVAG